jgi:hypothetical protein
MTISLLCPNGHKLLCPESQAGKRGKCPHCGAVFRVPEVSNSGTIDVGDLAAGGSSANGNGSSPTANPIPLVTASAAGQGSASAVSNGSASADPTVDNPIRRYDEDDQLGEDEISFLCPNGHHLRGGSELGGEPGTCPECGVKFLVPTEDELHEPHEIDEPEQSFGFRLDNHSDEEPVERSRGEFFANLWSYKARGATIELYLEGGTMLIPDGYAAELSRNDEGVFLVRESDGTFTVAVVSWKSITHMAVRGLEQVPEGVFDIP